MDRQLLDPPVYCPVCGGRLSTNTTAGLRRWWCEDRDIEIGSWPALALQYLVQHPQEAELASNPDTAYPVFCPRCAATLQSPDDLPEHFYCSACHLRVPTVYVAIIQQKSFHPYT